MPMTIADASAILESACEDPIQRRFEKNKREREAQIEAVRQKKKEEKETRKLLHLEKERKKAAKKARAFGRWVKREAGRKQNADRIAVAKDRRRISVPQPVIKPSVMAVFKSEARKRAAPWEGRGNRD